jgi:hypothetical protein
VGPVEVVRAQTGDPEAVLARAVEAVGRIR